MYLVTIILYAQKADREVIAERSVKVNVPIDELWEIVGIDFGGIDKWNSSINVSDGVGEGLNGISYNTRVCKNYPDDPNPYVEILTDFNPKNYSFAYRPENLPSNMEEAVSYWSMKKDGKGSILTMKQKFVFYKVEDAKSSREQVEAYFNPTFDKILDELRVYAETGKPHPDKAAAIKKHQDKLSRGAYSFKVFPPLNSLEAIQNQHVASPLAATYLKSKNNYVKVVYSRPSLNERKIIGGDAAPYGQVWRLGANEQTEISFTKPISIGGKRFEAGTYSLFAIPNEKEWTIIVNSALGDWGAFSYKKEKDLHTFKAKVDKAEKKHEKFTIWFSDDATSMNLAWDEILISIPISIS